MEAKHRPNETPMEILHKAVYTPSELAELLEVDVNLIRRAAFKGNLQAVIVGNDIVGIPREAALRWLNEGLPG